MLGLINNIMKKIIILGKIIIIISIVRIACKKA